MSSSSCATSATTQSRWLESASRPASCSGLVPAACLGSSLGRCVLVVKNEQAFEARYGAGYRVAGSYGTSNLSNGGEVLTLLDAGDTVIQSFAYDDDPAAMPPWPTSPDGGGPSLTILRTNLDYSLGSSWRPSFAIGGTPGSEENDAPEDLWLISSRVPENAPGAKVGDIAVVRSG